MTDLDDDAALRARVRTVVGALLARNLPIAQDDAALADIEPDRYDSLGVLDCVGAIEHEFGVSVDLVDDDLRVTFRSVTSISGLVTRKLADDAVLGWAQ